MPLFNHFTVIPAIDLKGGKVVRLLRGEMANATTYGEDPAEAARSFERDGAELIHVVDLDGAIAGEPRNRDAIHAIRGAVRCRIDVSGGLRSIEAVRQTFEAGADVISIGSAAFLNPQLIKDACAEFPGRVIGSIDARNGRLAIKGWVETSELTVPDAAARFRAASVTAVTVTDISRDGTQAGANAEVFAAVASQAGVPVIASGGVATLDDLRGLAKLFNVGVIGAITGRALYERRFSLPDAIAATR
ncbi:MAG TPA: 1-(5-phosphoribosyl)-5-[(5-phosphoribosylamino)methylideneamino]imidazole-4-carboxamide isomerase [Candidatus Binataceae bacterium]|nr:1-(5-phosphoribosyl)-5-[(5-phosphoribosylamino)methylideneamino]imidazole-4-carboxamide isomerase [Candidatus Binataceae bacterium]